MRKQIRKHHFKSNIRNTAKNNVKIKAIKWQTTVLIFVGLILLVLMIFFAIRTYDHYVELREHRDYFMQPNVPIQDWMTVRSVVRHYDLSESQIYSELNVSPGALVDELGIDNSTVIDRITIREICVKKHLDCNLVVNRLNSIRTK